MLTILRAGVQTTVQDLGRGHAMQWGVPEGGAADKLALQLANLLLGNAPADAALEITLGGFAARFDVASGFALAGADCQAELDGRLLLPHGRYQARAGSVLQLGRPSQGGRSYLALPGGVDVPLVLGSRATLLAGGFGGLNGRSLQRNDVIRGCRPMAEAGRKRQIAGPALRPVLRCLPGPQWQALDDAAKKALQGPWRVAAQSNRMGLRLDGERIAFKPLPLLMSHAVLAGSIQLPPAGLPIILQADAQTTGGYPLIAQVIAADLWRLGQLRAGEVVHLQPVDETAAIRALRAQRAWLARLAQQIQQDW